MLHSQLTIPYTLGVKVPDTTRSFLRLGVSSPQTEPNYQGLAAYRAGPFLLRFPDVTVALYANGNGISTDTLRLRLKTGLKKVTTLNE